MFVGVDFPGGKLKEDASQRVAELALDQQFAVVQRRHHHHGPWMGDPLAHGLMSVGQAHGIAPYMQQLAVKNRLAVHGMFNQFGIVHVCFRVMIDA